MKTHFTLLLLFISALSFCQNQNKIDLEKLKINVHKLINQERENNDRKILNQDLYLKKAAEDHAKFIAKIQNLSHEQTDEKKLKPKDRVFFHGGNSFVLVGENLLFTSIKEQIYTDEDLETLALKMFNLWKNSPNHYKNMIEHKYLYTEIGFSIDWENNKIYAVQLFGAK